MNVNTAVSFFGKILVDSFMDIQLILKSMPNVIFCMYFCKCLVLKLQITCILNRAGNYSQHM